jgi:hypothetical protein
MPLGINVHIIIDLAVSHHHSRQVRTCFIFSILIIADAGAQPLLAGLTFLARLVLSGSDLHVAAM